MSESNKQDSQQAAAAAGNGVIDAVIGQLVRQLAAAEARAAGLAVQLQAAQSAQAESRAS